MHFGEWLRSKNHGWRIWIVWQDEGGEQLGNFVMNICIYFVLIYLFVYLRPNTSELSRNRWWRNWVMNFWPVEVHFSSWGRLTFHLICRCCNPICFDQHLIIVAFHWLSWGGLGKDDQSDYNILTPISFIWSAYVAIPYVSTLPAAPHYRAELRT